MCAHCNFVKESPDWQVSPSEVDGVHTAEFVTPTGALYRSTAPPLPGSSISISEVEVGIGIELADLHAA
jgi:hypothetical protein